MLSNWFSVPIPAEVNVLEDERADGNEQTSSFEKRFFVKLQPKEAAHQLDDERPFFIDPLRKGDLNDRPTIKYQSCPRRRKAVKTLPCLDDANCSNQHLYL
jgi:hypothetical protein